MKSLCTFFLVCALSLAVTPASHADDRTEIQQIREQLKVLNARLDALEARNADAIAAKPGGTVSAGAAKVSGKLKTAQEESRIAVSGDLRFRHESIDEQTRVNRTRQRVRARIGLKAKVAPNADVVVRLASGSDDPVSTNQSLDNAASTKDIRLDRAYFSLAPSATTKVVGGKMKNPFYQPGSSSLIWDSDLSPEGLAWSLAQRGFFVNVASLWVEERSSRSDSMMYGAQAGFKTEWADGAQITAGLGHLDYAATQGRGAFFDGEGRGNRLDSSGAYIHDFNLTEVFAEVSTKLTSLPFSVFAHWVRNGGASDDNRGYLVGGRIGKASSSGQWEFEYSFRDLEADAVIATFTDSDIGGGGTAIRGHVFNFSYAFSKRLGASLTYLASENGVGTADNHDYDRLQADFSLSY